MTAAALPVNEAERLKCLKSYEILDTESEEIFDQIVRLASFICATPISTITLIDERRQWFKSQVGLQSQQTSRDVAFCAHAILQDELMIVTDATKDHRFKENPLVTGTPDIRFYAGIPFTSSDGLNLGTLCVIDTKPRELDTDQKFALKVLRNQIMKLFELRRKNIALKRNHEMNNRLLSIIGHDLRAPLHSMNGLLHLCQSYEFSKEEIDEMHESMKKQIDGTETLLKNLLHWTKTQIESESVTSEPVNIKELISDIKELVKLNVKNKGNNLSIGNVEECMIASDKNKIDFILRNIILNANKYTQNGNITVSTQILNNHLEISIADTGIGMDEARKQTIFTWGNRQNTDGTSGEKGFGFGLPMCKEFTEDLCGTLTIESKPGAGTTVHITLPIN